MSNLRSSPEAAAVSGAVSAVVKWFNPNKGYGFVQPADGTGDVFLHASVVRRLGHADLPDGAKITCEIVEGPRGPQVATIHNIAVPDGAEPSSVAGDAEVVEGTVKFYDPVRGYGFAVPDGGGRDVFISSRSLERSGVTTLASEQRVRMSTSVGKKGPMANSVELL
jgi:CspA family cold shock protein